MFFSCNSNSNSNPERRLLKTSIHMPSEYRIIEYENDWAIGESTENYMLLIDTNDYRKIVQGIKELSVFQEHDTCKIPKYVFDENININKIKETACRYSNKYFYQIFRPDPGVIITVELKKDSLMQVIYEDL